MSEALCQGNKVSQPRLEKVVGPCELHLPSAAAVAMQA